MINISKNIVLFLLLAVGAAVPCFAEIAIIVHPENTTLFAEAEVRNIFLGKVKVFDNGLGLPIVAIDIEPGDPARKEFIANVLHKTEANINAYWVRMLFSSKAEPPRKVKNSAEVMAIIAKNPSAIGYVDSKLVDSSVRVLFLIQ